MNFDPIGGGFLFERLVDFLFSFGEEGGWFFRLLAVLKKISFVLIPIFVVWGFWLLVAMWEFRPKFRIIKAPIIPQERIARRRWEEIEKRASTGLDSDLALAIIEADNLVDDIFKRIGFPGESFAERMEHVSLQEMASLGELKEAHRLRNNIAHTPGYRVSRQEAQRTLERYRRALEELEVL